MFASNVVGSGGGKDYFRKKKKKPSGATLGMRSGKTVLGWGPKKGAEKI